MTNTKINVKNFFQQYRIWLAEAIGKFIKDHPQHNDIKEMIQARMLLLDLDYEGDELCPIFSQYENIEYELADGYINDSEDIRETVHDNILEYLCDYFNVRFDNEKDYDELASYVVENEKVKEFIKKCTEGTAE